MGSSTRPDSVKDWSASIQQSQSESENRRAANIFGLGYLCSDAESIPGTIVVNNLPSADQGRSRHGPPSLDVIVLQHSREVLVQCEKVLCSPASGQFFRYDARLRQRHNPNLRATQPRCVAPLHAGPETRPASAPICRTEAIAPPTTYACACRRRAAPAAQLAAAACAARLSRARPDIF